MNIRTTIAGAAIGAVAAFTIGTASVSWAQESTTTTEPPAAGQQPPALDNGPGAGAGDHDCDERGQAGGRGDAPGSTGPAAGGDQL